MHILSVSLALKRRLLGLSIAVWRSTSFEHSSESPFAERGLVRGVSRSRTAVRFEHTEFALAFYLVSDWRGSFLFNH